MHIKEQIYDTIKNISFYKEKLAYIIEPSNWSIKWDGIYITNELNKLFSLNAYITSSRFALRNKILHFGSLGTYIKYSGIVPVHHSNKIVFTWFHMPYNDSRTKFIPDLNKKTDFVQTSCEITKKILISNGLDEERIVVAPIGIDLKLFRKFPEKERIIQKKSLNLPKNKIIIGSFQKDGVGWSDGNEPKMIKGPDIFCNVVEKLAVKYDIHVLLTGPSRGYVINSLKKTGVDFTHVFLNNFSDIVKYYNVLDLYIISSRVEGGPKALTESMACGVPVVSTRVGMVPEIIINGKNGFVADVEDVETLTKYSMEIIESKGLKEEITKQALADVKNYSWQNTVKILYDKIYSKLL
jgi:glycosyltransferase involved in cell wall biosynthesis